MRSPLLFALLLCPACPSSFSPHFRWVEGENCPTAKGRVTDQYCCNDEKFCSAFQTQKACIEGDGGTQSYCHWLGGECLPKVDSESDVCCVKGKVGEVCNSLLKGQCPDEWQVDERCCVSPSARKHSWLGANEGKVCCNAPCVEAEKSGCGSLPAKCAPLQRSWAMFKPQQALGFNFGPKSEGVLRSFRFGNVLYGTGFAGDKPGLAEVKLGRGVVGHDFSKDKHVEEITVDDVFMLLIEAFEKDSDVKMFDSDISSDPYMGTTKSGGLFVDHRFPDAGEYLDRIYGGRVFGPYPPTYGVPTFEAPLHGAPPYGATAHGPYGPSVHGPTMYGLSLTSPW